MQFLGTIDTNSALLRSGARPGDLVFVTGTIGDAAAGLQLRKDRVELTTTDQNFLVSRYEVPTARVAAGIALRGIATAAIDISDGLVNDLTHLCNASSCGAKIDVDNLPLSQALIAVFGSEAGTDFALSGGDDYELCFTLPVEHRETLAAVQALHNVPVHEIGVVEIQTGLRCVSADGRGRRRAGSCRSYRSRM